MLFGIFTYMQMHTEQLPSDDSAGMIRLVELLGSGGSGTVFRAHRANVSGEEFVAVKLPRGADPANDSLTAEAAALRRFAHPNIIELLEDHTVTTNGELAGALVLELCQGGTIEDLVTERALDASEVHHVVVAIGSALATIHAAGWIHGDVNPSNLGLRPKSGPALFDFGTCRPADGTPTAHDARGTIEFSGPRLRTSPIFDIRSLTASALWMLGNAEDFSRTDQRVATGLEQLITRCDSSETGITLDDLYAVFEGVSTTAPIATTTPRTVDGHLDHLGARTRTTGPLAQTGGPSDPGSPDRPRTRPFGPGPFSERDDLPSEAQSPGGFGRKALAGVAVIALASLMGIEIVGHSAHAAAAESEPIAINAFNNTLIDAQQTLDDHRIIWSTIHGSATLEIDGETVTFTPGQMGDLGAVGDWDCDGTTTLGIFRPSTGAWFTFDDWSTDATSTVTPITSAASPSSLLVTLDAQGCASPSVQ